MKFFWQNLHWKGFSPVWILSWAFIALELVNLLVQILQSYMVFLQYALYNVFSMVSRHYELLHAFSNHCTAWISSCSADIHMVSLQCEFFHEFSSLSTLKIVLDMSCTQMVSHLCEHACEFSSIDLNWIYMDISNNWKVFHHYVAFREL